MQPLKQAAAGVFAPLLKVTFLLAQWLYGTLTMTPWNSSLPFVVDFMTDEVQTEQ